MRRLRGTVPSLAADLQKRVEAGVVKTRAQAAAVYAQIIAVGQYQQHVDVAALNAALERRWSRSGLVHIKQLAWKLWATGPLPPPPRR